jgi:hypothetical protein
LGQDRPLETDELGMVARVAQVLEAEWNQQELAKLNEDLANFQAYNDGLEMPLAEYLVKLQEDEDREVDQNASVLEPFKDNEKALAY